MDFMCDKVSVWGGFQDMFRGVCDETAAWP